MKHFIKILILQLFVCTSVGIAQQSRTISGKVYDSIAEHPIQGATVQWLNSHGRLMTATVSDSKGNFVLKIDIEAGKGKLQVLYVGYKTLDMPLNASETDRLLNTLCLTPDYNTLKDVEVTGQKMGYRVLADKKVYDVASNLSAQGGTLEEVFKQIPGVMVSALGQLTLRSASPKILIDGKRTNLTLEQIPAEQVESVEIITNPSAKYDAQGGSGIINIIMRKNKTAGLKGNIEGNFTSMPEKTLDGNISLTTGKFSFMAGYFQHWHRGKYKDELFRNTLADGTSLKQNSTSETKGPFQTGRLSIDYRLNTNNTFTLSGNYGGGDFTTTNHQNSTYYINQTTQNKEAKRTSLSKENVRFSHVNLDYNHQFKKKDEKLISSFNMEQYNAPTRGTYQMQYIPLQKGLPNSYTVQQYAGGIRAHTITLQSDYTNPLRDGKAKLEAGIKLNWHKDHNHNVMQDYDTTMQEYVVNPYATYDFYYEDPTYAAYGNYSDKYGWFGFTAGLRFEQYNYTGSLPDSAITFKYHNPNLFPSLFLTADLGGGQQLQLNYSRRVNRPDFDQVSPRTDYSNPQNLSQGNPDLKSEYTNLAELSYNYQKNATLFTATLYVRNTNNFITAYTTSYAPDTLLTTFANAKYNNTFGGEIIYKTDIIKGWSVTANANVFDTRISATNLDPSLNTDGFSWFSKLNIDIKLPRDIAVQLSGSYTASSVMQQGKTFGTGSMDIALKKDFLPSKKLRLIASLADVFNTDRNKQHTFMAGQYDQYYLQKPLTRVFKVTVSWSFGNAKS